MGIYVSGQIESRAHALIQFATSVSPARPSLSCLYQTSLQASLAEFEFITACIKGAGETTLSVHGRIFLKRSQDENKGNRGMKSVTQLLLCSPKIFFFFP